MSLVRKLAFSAAATLAGLLLLEGAARLAEPHLPDPTVLLPSPAGARCEGCLSGAAGLDAAGAAPAVRLVWSTRTQTWHALSDDAVRKDDRHEIRGAPPASDRPEDAVEILTLGDSSVWGHGVPVDAVFSSVAARQLSEAWERPVHATIGAQPGHTSVQSLQVLRVLGPELQPDVVLVASLWSDLFHHASPAWAAAPGASAPSALYRLLLTVLAPSLSPGVVTWLDPDRGVGMPGPGTQPRTPPDVYTQTLRALAKAATELGAQPAFLVLPAPLDRSPVVPPFVDAYRARLRGVARTVGAPLVDAAAAFRDGAPPADGFADSVHPDAAGHARIGALLAEAMETDPAAWGVRR